MYNTLIFDFNGTLIDDCDVCLEILNILCKENNLPLVSKRKYKSIFTFPVSSYYKIVGFDTSSKSFEKIGNRFHEFYNVLSYQKVKLFKNVNTVLNDLSKKYTLVCLSASMQETLLKQLKFYKIDQYFTYIVGLNNNKAHSKKEVACNFIKDNNIDCSKALFIGDSIHDLEVANVINTKCVLLSTGHTAKSRLKKVNDIVIDDIKEIYNYL